MIGPYIDGCGWAQNRLIKKLIAHVEEFEAQEEQNTAEAERKTFLEKLMYLLKKEKTSMTRDRVVGNLLTLFLAGIDTVGTTTLYCLWKLAEEESGLQEELAREVLEVDGLENVTMDNINTKLPRIRSFLFEILRFWSPVRVLIFKCFEEATLAGTKLPVGTEIMACTHRGSRVSEDAQDTLGVPLGPNGEGLAEFCPRRWLQIEKSKVSVLQPTNVKGGYPSFGHGARICPGKDLAELEVALVLASVIEKFSISMKPGHAPIKIIALFTATPDIDIELIMSPRLEKETASKDKK